MVFKSKIAFFSALLVMLSSGSLPAFAAAVSPAALSWSAPLAATPTAAVDISTVVEVATPASSYLGFLKFTSALASGDVWAVSVSVVRPVGSQVSMTDNNGSAAGASAVFAAYSGGDWVSVPAYSATTGLITATAKPAGFSSTAFTRMGSFSFTPDVPGEYSIVLTAMSDSGSGWQPLGSVTQKFSLQAYGVIDAQATLVQAVGQPRGFATGVELDADGNVYWLDDWAWKVFKTNEAGVTTQFCTMPEDATKLFIDGAWLYVQSNDRVYRIALNNSDPLALASLVQGQAGMLPSARYSQAIGYTRISGQNYVIMENDDPWSYHLGELWRYPVATEPVRVSSFSVSGNVATLAVPAAHGLAVGDVVKTLNIGSTGTTSRTITESTASTIKFAFTSVNVTSTATPAGQVAKTTVASTLLATVPGFVRGLKQSLDGRYLYMAVEAGKKIVRMDTQNFAAGTQLFADLSPTGVNYSPDDLIVLDDGSFVVSGFAAGGRLWHISASGKILSKINMTLNGTNVVGGYDLRMSPDGTKIYLAAQYQGFLSLALSRPLSGSTRGTSNPIVPTSGPIPATAAAGSMLSTGATLRGSVNPNGAVAQAQFRWSSDPTFPAGSTSTSSIQNLLSGSVAQPLEHEATGLTANTTYYFQIMAGSGSANEVFGGVRSFKTSVLTGITAVSPNTGAAIGGTAVQLTIQGFSSAPTVKVGGVLATNVVFTAPGTLSFITPPQAGTGILLESGSLSASAGFIYSAPLITAISPVSGVEAGGFAVTVSGSNFTGATGLTVAGIATTFTFVSDGSLTFTAPANSLGAKTVQVTTPSGTAAIQLTYEPALPNPAPTQSAPSAPSTPSNPAPEAPTIRAPRAVISVTLSRGAVDHKSRIVLTLPEAAQDSPINSVRVHLKNAQGEITQTLVIPIKEATDTLDFEVPMTYGEYDVSVSTFNAAGYSSEVVNVGGIVAKDTISGISPTKWPTIKGVKMLSKLLFEPNSAKLTAASEKSLLAIREKLRGFEGRILISGFAAKFGPSSRGKQISVARALAVAKKLKALGMNSWIEYHGHGQLPSSARGMRRVDVSLIEYSVLEK